MPSFIKIHQEFFFIYLAHKETQDTYRPKP